MKQLDENLEYTPASENNIRWIEVTADKFKLYGIQKYSEAFLRIASTEKSIEKLGIRRLENFSTGGRIRFSTNSSFVAIRSLHGETPENSMMGTSQRCGYDLYTFENGKETFSGLFRPPYVLENGEYTSKLEYNKNREYKQYTLYFPIFTVVKRLFIGIEEEALLEEGAPYINEKPVVYYGSSITQGCGASRTGNTYPALISQNLNLDFINLGAAGNAKGEQAVAEYISRLQMSLFVYDYDFNAPNAEYLEKTHYAMYKTVRKKTDVPIIMLSAVPVLVDGEWSKRRRIIMESYERARANGDGNVYFIDGRTLFDGEKPLSCSLDGTHPNDIGYYRMAENIGAMIKKLIHK